MKTFLSGSIALLFVTGCASTVVHENNVPSSVQQTQSSGLKINTANADLIFSQSSHVVVEKNNNKLVLYFKSEAITISTPHDNIRLCLTKTENASLDIPLGTDVRRDITSCMAEQYQMSAANKANYLFVGDKLTNRISAKKQLQKLASGTYRYQIDHLKFYDESILEVKETQALANIEERLHGAIWIDKNHNHKLDQGEYTQLIFDIQS